jgi:outer membrane lipoprotein-sorting protein
MVRRLIVLAFAAAFSAAVTGRAATQSVDDLVAKNLEAKGGLTRLKAVQSVKQTARFTMQGMDGTMTVYLKRPNKVRQEVTVGGRTVINAFDGVTPWIVNPLVGGSTRPMVVTGPQADMLREQGDFDGPLVDYKVKGYSLELAGLEASGDRKVHHLRLVSASGQTVHLYIDAASNLEVRRVTDVDQLKLEQEFSDFKPVEGVTLPFVIRLLANGVPQSEMRVQSVELNTPIDDAIFRLPKG